MTDTDPRAGQSSGSQGAEASDNRQEETPRHFGKLKVDFRQGEEIPQYQVALITATAGSLGAPRGVGRGLQPAEPEEGRNRKGKTEEEGRQKTIKLVGGVGSDAVGISFLIYYSAGTHQLAALKGNTQPTVKT